MIQKKDLKTAFIKSIPILCSYIFVGIAYGIMMENAGFKWYYSLLVSLTVYTGAYQFVLVTLLSSSITFLKDFKSMGKRMPYMVLTMSDETYAVNCSLEMNDDKERKDIMFWVAMFSRIYWMAGSVIGGVLGQLIPFEFEGRDFCMTALFVIIFIDQWENADKHTPALLGIAVGIICLVIFGQGSFMLPALLIASAILIMMQRKEQAE